MGQKVARRPRVEPCIGFLKIHAPRRKYKWPAGPDPQPEGKENGARDRKERQRG